MLYCHANNLHADCSENSTAAVWQQQSVAHLQSDWCRCRADLREQITLPFFQQTKCTCYLNISGPGPSQSALLVDHFAAKQKMSLSEEVDDDDWVTWRGVRSATGLGNMLQVESLWWHLILEVLYPDLWNRKNRILRFGLTATLALGSTVQWDEKKPASSLTNTLSITLRYLLTLL